ncbi:MAG: D-alanyl-D-alanine carboxypeptidase [Clostridia bacterium]|nr:D-alanyl-D-alanine carboxypeptidase [Clostridia bacterium]
MNNRLRRVICVMISFALLIVSVPAASFAAEFDIGDDIPSAIVMEASTGTVISEKNADERRAPASVTKVMTMLLIMEAVDCGKIGFDDTVTVSAYASSMGGSQVYLKEGEQMTVRDMLKSITVASANDACVAMAEHIAGSEQSFVDMMNEKAAALGMQNTHFENTNGLDDTATDHYTTARDIALMSRELLKHKTILEFSSIWMDSIRNGEFGLTNTNRLIRFYKGANGLKTGSTSKAGFCISATAERGGMTLICVIMGAPTRDSRNEAAKRAFDFGFSNFALYASDGESIEDFPVVRGKDPTCGLTSDGFVYLCDKSKVGSVVRRVELPEYIAAPMKAGNKVGKIVYSIGEEIIGETPIVLSDDLPEITFGGIVAAIFKRIFMI